MKAKICLVPSAKDRTESRPERINWRGFVQNGPSSAIIEGVVYHPFINCGFVPYSSGWLVGRVHEPIRSGAGLYTHCTTAICPARKEGVSKTAWQRGGKYSIFTEVPSDACLLVMICWSPMQISLKNLKWPWFFSWVTKWAANAWFQMVVDSKVKRFLALIAWCEIFFGNPLNYRSDGVSETWNSGPRVPGIERPEISSFSNGWLDENFICSRCLCGLKCLLNYK